MFTIPPYVDVEPETLEFESEKSRTAPPMRTATGVRRVWKYGLPE